MVFTTQYLNTLMVIKNLLLFVSGITIGALLLALIVSYYLFTVERVKTKDKFIIAENEGSLIWNKPETFLEALEAFVMVIMYHFSPRKKRRKVILRSTKRGKIILVSFLLLIVLVIGGSIYISFDLQYRVQDDIREIHEILVNEEYEKLEEFDAKYHEWMDSKIKEPTP